MHIPDHVLSPAVSVATGLVAVAGLGYCLKKLEHVLGERTTVLMGIMAAFLFAAQMVNFPVGLGVSGHLLGGVLAAVTLGPWAGAVVIAAVLIVQCLLFGDGGITALGANYVNIGLIGSLGGYAIYAPLRRLIQGPKGILIGAMAAAWFSVLLASGACALELSASVRGTELLRVLGWMVLVHSVIGVGEALITGLVLRFVLLTRPDLIHESESTEEGASTAGRWVQLALGGLGIAMAVAVLLAPFASEYPDGLEWVGKKLGLLMEESGPVMNAPVADYKIPGLTSMGTATALAGLLGTVVVFGVGLGLARAFTGRAISESTSEVSEEVASNAV